MAHNADKPHIVLIMCDQLRADALGFMGNNIVRTPNLDRLANSGVTFDNMFVQSPVCIASRSCLFTGRYVRTCRMGSGTVLDPRETTMPEILQRKGYRTALFGKLHLTPQLYTFNDLKSEKSIPDSTPFLQVAGLPPIPDDPAKKNYGLQHVVGHEDGLWGEYKEWLFVRDPKLAAMLPAWGLAMWEGRTHYPDSPGVGPTIIPTELHPSTFIGTSAADYFRDNHAHGPCFMQVSFVDPHSPFDPPADALENYDWHDMPLPPYSDTGNIEWPDTLMKKRTDYSKVTPELTKKTIACYYAMIDVIDRSVGHLVDTIEQAGEMENTLFVFIADHGEFLGNYGLFLKGSFHYDCLIRVPSFISWAGSGLTAGDRQSGLLQAIDILPTLLGFLSIESDLGIQGMDISGDLLEGRSPERPWVFCEKSFESPRGPFVPCWTLRTEHAKLNYYPEDKVGHLFDLDVDPDERTDVYLSEKHRSLRDDMTAELLTCLHSQVDPIPRMVTQY